MSQKTAQAVTRTQSDSAAEGLLVQGGVKMREAEVVSRGSRKSQIVHGIIAAILFSLVMGIWVSLWVPAVPIP